MNPIGEDTHISEAPVTKLVILRLLYSDKRITRRSMMYLKRSLLALILLVLLCTLVFVQAEQGKPLVMASATRLNGSFFTSQFGENTADIEVRKLLSGYPTTVLTQQNKVELNPTVVAKVEESEQDGLKVYTITI